MDPLESYELYVPKEAEVLAIPENRLPSSVFSRISEVCTGRTGALSRTTTTWISPVVIRQRAQPPQDLRGCRHTGVATSCLPNAVLASASIQPCHWLPITCAHLAAFKVLRELLSSEQGHQNKVNGKEVLRDPAPLPPGRILRFTQDTIIIHQGQIFLSVKSSVASLKEKRPTGLSQPVKPRVSARRKHESQGGSPCVRQTPGSLDVKEEPLVITIHPKGAGKPWDSQDWLRSFGITKEVCIALEKLPEMYIRSSGAVMLISQPKPTADPGLQMSPPGGLLLKQSMSYLQDSCGTQHLDKERLRNSESVEGSMEPVLKKPRPVPSSLLSQGYDLELVNDNAVCGKEVGNMTSHGHPEVTSVPRQKDQGVEGQQEAKSDAHGDELTHGCEVSDGEDVTRSMENTTSHAHHCRASSYPSVSSSEDHDTFDFEQLAREERINRIREKIREKEAALKSFTSVH